MQPWMMRDNDKQDLCNKYFLYLILLFVLRYIVRNGFTFVEFLQAKASACQYRVLSMKMMEKVNIVETYV